MINVKRLDTGVILVTEYVEHVKSVTAGVWVGAGSVSEDEYPAGISHFTEHMMFKGTNKRDSKKIAMDIDRIGAQNNAFTGKEYTCYFVKSTEANIFKALDVLTDMIEDPMLLKEEMDRERNVIKEEIKMNFDSPDYLAMEKASELVYAGSNLSNSILGTEDSIDKIDTDTMRSYINDFYTRDRMVISVAGNFKQEEIERFFENKFLNLNEAQRNFVERRAKYEKKEITITKDIEQAHICMAVPAISTEDDRYYAMNVLSNAVGESMSSRLFQKVREEMGLAYSVASSLSTNHRGGEFSIYAGVAKEKIEDAIRGIKDVVNEVKEKGLTDEEISSSIEQLKSAYIYTQENMLARMIKNGKNTLLSGRIYTPEEIMEAYDRVDSSEIKNALDIIGDVENFSIAIVSGDVKNRS